MDASDVIRHLHPTTKTGRTHYLTEEETCKAIDPLSFKRKQCRKPLLK